MTAPFVKNRPARQLLSFFASFSWALQREAWGRAHSVLRQVPLVRGQAILQVLCISGAGGDGRAWKGNTEFLEFLATMCKSQHTPCKREKGSSVSGSLLTFNLRSALIYVFLLNCRCSLLLHWSEDQRVSSKKE